MYSIFPYVGQKRIVRVTKQDLLLMLSIQDNKKPVELVKLDPKTQEKIKSIGKFWEDFFFWGLASNTCLC